MTTPDSSSQPTPVTGADVANAKQLTQIVGQISQAMSGGSAAVITALGAIATAITNSIIGGSTGTTANRALVSKGTTGRALQASPVAIDASSNVTPSTSGMALRANTANGNTITLQAYDVDGAAYVDLATGTSANVPTFDLTAGATKGGIGIATVTQAAGLSYTFKAPEDETVPLYLNFAFGWTITSVTTITEVGTSTVTVLINTTPLGGSANSASTSQQTQVHSSANVVAIGDKVQVTFASTSSDCENLCVTIQGTLVLA